MKSPSALGPAALLVLAAGCASTDRPPSSPEPAVSFDYLFPKPGERADLACPVELPGARVSSIVTDRGSMLVFTGEDGTFELRRRARLLADELGERGRGELSGIATEARYDEIPGGATVELMPLRARDVWALRERVEELVVRMQRKRSCLEGLVAQR